MPETMEQYLVDPSAVGNAFVKQYYIQMHRDPSQLHRFYLDQSSYVHGGSEMGSETPVIGQKVRSVGRGIRGAVECLYATVRNLSVVDTTGPRKCVLISIERCPFFRG